MIMYNPSEAVSSPCIKVCKMDGEHLCVGCRRTIEEIADWMRLTDAERVEVLNRIKRRRADSTPANGAAEF
jgi:predicted Fe-S protein YdhL (DUF1289 family)